MVSTRDAVIASLKSKLETITTGNGYQQSVGDVLDYPVQMADLDGYDFPNWSPKDVQAALDLGWTIEQLREKYDAEH